MAGLGGYGGGPSRRCKLSIPPRANRSRGTTAKLQRCEIMRQPRIAITPSQREYLNLAAQCEARAKNAISEAERSEYLAKAKLWHRLARARLPEGTSRSHFPPRPAVPKGRSRQAIRTS